MIVRSLRELGQKLYIKQLLRSEERHDLMQRIKAQYGETMNFDFPLPHSLQIFFCPFGVSHGNGGGCLRDGAQNIRIVSGEDFIVRTVKRLTGIIAGACPRRRTDDLLAGTEYILPHLTIFGCSTKDRLQSLCGYAAEGTAHRTAKTELKDERCVNDRGIPHPQVYPAAVSLSDAPSGKSLVLWHAVLRGHLVSALKFLSDEIPIAKNA